MYMYICIGSTNESQHRLSMWQHVLGACIKHSHEMEKKENMMQPHGGGRMEERKDIAMHCTEMNEVRSA